jgi:hypothetical protein
VLNKKQPNRNRDFIEVEGLISEDTFWEADTVKVVGDIRVLNNAILTIAPGTVVEFQDYYKMKISGTLLAVGTADNRIIFTADDPEDFVIDSSHSGCWQGIRFYDISSLNEASMLEYCVFEFSKATDNSERYFPFGGGAISIYNFSKLIISNCIFRNNVADYGGAVFCSNYSAPIIVSNLFYENYALKSTSSIYNCYAYPKIINNTIIDNSCLNEDVVVATGTILNYISKPLVKNNIIWDNPSNFFEHAEIWESKLFYTYNNVIEGFENLNENIDSNPSLLDDAELPYMISDHSVCTNNGTHELESCYLPEYDLAGNPRISDNFIDIGAYEFQFVLANEDETLDHNQNFQLRSFPNPFRISTKITFALSAGNGYNTQIEIYNIKGQLIRKLKLENVISGNYEVVWDGKNESGYSISSGLYFCKIKSGTSIQTTKLMIVK